MYKYQIFIGVLAIIVVATIVGAFSIVGTPATRKQIEEDKVKISDFQEVRNELQNLNFNSTQLPESITTDSHLPEKILQKFENNTYTYIKVSAGEYKLCTIFSTDSDKNKDNYNYNYSYPNEKTIIKYKKGYDCINFKVTLYNNPTPIPLNN